MGFRFVCLVGKAIEEQSSVILVVFVLAELALCDTLIDLFSSIR